MDKRDIISMDVPLFIRMLELAREDIKSDAELHKVVDRVIDKKNKVLTMDDYDYFVQNMSFSNGGELQKGIKTEMESKLNNGGQTPAQQEKIAKVMREFKEGKLKTSYGEKVTDDKQAIAIALSEAGISRKAEGGYVINEEIANNSIQNPVIGMAVMNKESGQFDSVKYVLDVFDNGNGVRVGDDGYNEGMEIANFKKKYRPATQEEVNRSKQMSKSLLELIFKNGGQILRNEKGLVQSIPYNDGNIKLNLESYWLDEDTDVELVPVSELIKFREFDRNVEPKWNKIDSDSNILKLKNSILQSGITEPLIVEYSIDDNAVLLIEGNHRLNSAILLGLEYFPVRVVKKTKKFNPKQLEKAMKVSGVKPNEHGYIPSNMKPSKVGINSISIMKEGGIIEGQLHSECNDETGCGRKFQVGNGGHIIEAERDEAVIVAKTFEDEKIYTIKGTPSQIASGLNVIGGGKNFDVGAEILDEKNEKMKIPELSKKAENTDVDDVIDSGSIIINRRSMADGNKYEVTGTTKQIASAINSVDGNGVIIENGAEITKLK
jgi:hypothetical protein